MRVKPNAQCDTKMAPIQFLSEIASQGFRGPKKQKGLNSSSGCTGSCRRTGIIVRECAEFLFMHCVTWWASSLLMSVDMSTLMSENQWRGCCPILFVVQWVCCCKCFVQLAIFLTFGFPSLYITQAQSCRISSRWLQTTSPAQDRALMFIIYFGFIDVQCCIAHTEKLLISNKHMLREILSITQYSRLIVFQTLWYSGHLTVSGHWQYIFLSPSPLTNLFFPLVVV